MTINNRDQAIAFLYDRINYERFQSMPYSEQHMKLDRMRHLLEILGNPQDRLAMVHIAGTKGKGSTAMMLDRLFRCRGKQSSSHTPGVLRTGIYSSPHLHRVEERIAIDGQPCSESDFVRLVEQIRPAVLQLEAESPEMQPTFFEMMTAMALLHFVDQQVDVAILEVGLGGRLDSTNVCCPVVSIITSISYDHMRQLGPTLSEIAREKAGIVKSGVPVVSGVVQPEPRDAIRNACRLKKSPLLEYGIDFGFKSQNDGFAFWYRSDACALEYNDLRLSILGDHQRRNATVAIMAMLLFQQQTGIVCQQDVETAIRRALSEVRCPGRVELVATGPDVIVDGAHNVASIDALVHAIDSRYPRDAIRARHGKRFLLLAMSQEKDVGGMLDSLLGHFDHVVLTQYTDSPRFVPCETLGQMVQQRLEERKEGSRKPVRIDVVADPHAAWRFVRDQAAAQDLICITGSMYIAGQLRDSCRSS